MSSLGALADNVSDATTKEQLQDPINKLRMLLKCVNTGITRIGNYHIKGFLERKCDYCAHYWDTIMVGREVEMNCSPACPFSFKGGEPCVQNYPMQETGEAIWAYVHTPNPANRALAQEWLHKTIAWAQECLKHTRGEEKHWCVTIDCDILRDVGEFKQEENP